MSYILVIYYSKHGTTKKLANYIGNGIESSAIKAKIRTVPNVFEKKRNNIDDPYASIDDLKNCSGIIIGSPSYFGNMAAPLKHYIDQTSNLWIKGSLVDKPVAFFCSSSSMHGGQETTLISMMFPFIHHGAIVVGLPFFKTNLINTKQGGSPYGATHVNNNKQENMISDIEKELCFALGKRVGMIAAKLLK
jgi:NAD(P)H dehydrogenase (quinone)